MPSKESADVPFKVTVEEPSEEDLKKGRLTASIDLDPAAFGLEVSKAEKESEITDRAVQAMCGMSKLFIGLANCDEGMRLDGAGDIVRAFPGACTVFERDTSMRKLYQKWIPLLRSCVEKGYTPPEGEILEYFQDGFQTVFKDDFEVWEGRLEGTHTKGRWVEELNEKIRFICTLLEMEGVFCKLADDTPLGLSDFSKFAKYAEGHLLGENLDGFQMQLYQAANELQQAIRMARFPLRDTEIRTPVETIGGALEEVRRRFRRKP